MLKQIKGVALLLVTISSLLAIPATPAVAAEALQGTQAGDIDVAVTQASSANVNGRLNVKKEENATAPAMIVDLVTRPVGIAFTAVGAAFFVLSLPFTAAAGSTDEAGETLVREPFQSTFNRPLGTGILSSD